MKVIDVFYSESKNISCISVRYRGIKAGQKITDENDNLYEVYKVFIDCRIASAAGYCL